MKKLLKIIVMFIFAISTLSYCSPPTQFLAKLYTEALGVIPDPTGYNSWLNYFQQNGYNVTTLRNVAIAFYQTAVNPAGGLPHWNNAEMAVAMYRGLLSRDPDPAGYYWLRSLMSTNPTNTEISNAVTQITNSSEFYILVPKIFNSEPFGWVSQLPPTLDIDYAGQTGNIFVYTTQGALESYISQISNTGGGTIYIPQRRIIYLSHTLTIPRNITLTTCGAASLQTCQYIRFARFVRQAFTSGSDSDPSIIFGGPSTAVGNGRIEKIWIDGQYTNIPQLGNLLLSAKPEHIRMWNDGILNQCRITGSPGWSNCVTYSDVNNVITVSNNLITCYESAHYNYGTTVYFSWPVYARDAPRTDGISCNATNANIFGNSIVDATDVPIVLFSSLNSTTIQHSQVHDNQILNAGNCAYTALGFDPGPNGTYRSGIQRFTGSGMYNNLLWNSPNAHFDIGICAGGRPWWQTATNTSQDIFFHDNNSGSASIRANIGILIADVNNSNCYPFVANNAVAINLVNTTAWGWYEVALAQLNVNGTCNGIPMLGHDFYLYEPILLNSNNLITSHYRMR
jgi:hypothetical protein